MGDVVEINSAPLTPRTPGAQTPPISAPPSQFHSPSLSRSPLLSTIDTTTGTAAPVKTPRTSRPHTPRTSRPHTPRTSRPHTPFFITPLGSPIRKALKLTKLNPHDAWLPITESRNGNAFYAAFHTLCAGIGIQALVLPVSFTILGWTWGVITLTLAFIWQLYTLWILVQLHETDDGTRYSRYLHLFNATFGERLGKLLAVFPIMYLSGGTCLALIIIGGSTCKTFFLILCGSVCNAKPLTTAEWYLVFTCAAVLLSQLPNMNSIAGISLIGALTAVGFCTMMWVVSLTEGRLDGVSYDPIKEKSDIARVFGTLNALGIVAFAFRGHNLTLEIQGTMPSTKTNPSHVPMWRGVKFAYALIALCIFPLAIAGYWAYGQLIPTNGGMMTATYQFHSRDVSRAVLGLISLFVIINALSSFQIYGMPIFDHMESQFTTRYNKACPWWLRAVSRALFGFTCFFIAVAVPFLGSLAGLTGGLALPVTLVYPCFMWIATKKPKQFSPMWWINWVLGVVGTALSGLLIAAGLWVVIDTGITVSFFKPS